MDGEKYTLHDSLPRRALAVVGTYASERPPVLDGGMAVQMYAAKKAGRLLRPTNDADLIFSPRLTADSFRRGIGNHLQQGLPEYSPELNLLHHVYEVLLTDEDDRAFLVHTYKWSENGFAREKRNIERKISNAEQMRLPGNGSAVHVVRPEEIIQGKMKRLGKIQEHGHLEDDMARRYHNLLTGAYDSVGNDDFVGELEGLKRQKNDLPVQYDRGEAAFRVALSRYAASKDFYDIALLLKLADEGSVDFDELYLQSAVRGRKGI